MTETVLGLVAPYVVNLHKVREGRITESGIRALRTEKCRVYFVLDRTLWCEVQKSSARERARPLRGALCAGSLANLPRSAEGAAACWGGVPGRRAGAGTPPSPPSPRPVLCDSSAKPLKPFLPQWARALNTYSSLIALNSTNSVFRNRNLFRFYWWLYHIEYFRQKTDGRILPTMKFKILIILKELQGVWWSFLMLWKEGKSC